MKLYIIWRLLPRMRGQDVGTCMYTERCRLYAMNILYFTRCGRFYSFLLPGLGLNSKPKEDLVKDISTSNPRQGHRTITLHDTDTVRNKLVRED